MREIDKKLLTAISDCDIERVRELIKQKADVNASDGWAMLHYACSFEDSFDIVELLIDAGADINAKNRDGDTTLYLACKRGRTDTAELLLNKGVQEDINKCFYLACEENHTETAEMLLRHGADIKNAKSYVAACCRHGHCLTATAEMLLKKGADGYINDNNMTQESRNRLYKLRILNLTGDFKTDYKRVSEYKCKEITDSNNNIPALMQNIKVMYNGTNTMINSANAAITGLVIKSTTELYDVIMRDITDAPEIFHAAVVTLHDKKQSKKIINIEYKKEQVKKAWSVIRTCADADTIKFYDAIFSNDCKKN